MEAQAVDFKARQLQEKNELKKRRAAIMDQASIDLQLGFGGKTADELDIEEDEALGRMEEAD